MTHRLLVIDDNRELAENLVELFEDRGLVVHVVPRAKEGLEWARSHGFDLAFVDVNLPDTAGHELLPALRAASPNGEVILMTGHATVDSAIAALRVGAFHYVVKPFSAAELIATAERALRQVTLRAEREALARQLEASERRYRDVVESTQVLVLALDSTMHVRMANRRTVERLSKSQEEIIGVRFDELLPSDARQSTLDRLALAAQSADGSELEAPLLAKDGRTRVVRWHATPALATAADEGFALYLTGNDVTDRRALERRAAEAEALAQMGTLAAGLAHEIRNPLNAAGLQLHLLGRGVDRLLDDERASLRARVDIVAGELKRLERLLSDFLELARPRPIAREPIDLARLLEEVLSFHEPVAQQNEITLVRSLAEGHCLGDRERLKQVFHNLVLNAIEASPKGASVEIELGSEAEGRTLLASVIDHGRGIAPSALARVFEPFFTTKAAGTGLGLPIVWQILQRHGGSVQIDSVEAQGTRITVRLPGA